MANFLRGVVDRPGSGRDGRRSTTRCFWLDGGGAWTGRAALADRLAGRGGRLPDSRRPARCSGTRAGLRAVVGDDIFASSRSRDGDGRRRPGVHWVGYFGYASRADLPALRRLRGSGADARCGCGRATSRSSTTTECPVGRGGARSGATWRPRRLRRGVRRGPGAAAGRQLLRGQPHLPRRGARASSTRSTAYLRLRDLNPAPYAGFLQHARARGCSAPHLSGTPRSTADRSIETKPIKGTTPRGGSPRRTPRCATTWRAIRRSAPRT